LSSNLKMWRQRRFAASTSSSVIFPATTSRKTMATASGTGLSLDTHRRTLRGLDAKKLGSRDLR